MDKILRQIMEKLEKYESTHIKVDIGQKQRYLIRKNYEYLKELEPKSHIGVRYSNTSAIIRIVSQHIFTCRQTPAFFTLVELSDIFIIKRCSNAFIITLVFNLQYWEKNSITTANNKGQEIHIS